MNKYKINLKLLYLLGLLFFANFVSLHGEEWRELVDLRGDWKFNIGDDKSWSEPNFNDNSWDRINVPSSWEDQGYNGYNGYAWYRKKFEVPSSINKKNVYISLGHIDDVDEVYLNGRLVGSTGTFPPNFRTAYNAFRKYPVSADLFNIGKENTIAVKVYDSQLIGGIVSGDISIMVLETLDMQSSLDGFWRFKIGDDLNWKNPNFDDKDWISMPVPSFWEINGFMDYDGFAWYRKKFDADIMWEGEKLVLLLGKIDDIDQCYLNGKMIGSTGDFVRLPVTNKFNNEYLELRGYYIPENLLSFNEENVIAVRVYDGLRDGGIYQGPIGITTQEDYRNYWKEKKRKKSFWDYIFNR